MDNKIMTADYVATIVGLEENNDWTGPYIQYVDQTLE